VDARRIYLNSDPMEGQWSTNPYAILGTLRNPDKRWYPEAQWSAIDYDYKWISRYDFDIIPLQYPFTKKSTDLGIVIYYRGAQTKIPIEVYAKLMGVTVEPAKGDTVRHWPDPQWDNDVDNGRGGPVALANLLNVKATYASINHPDKQTDKELEYWHIAEPPYYKAGPYYLFATDETIVDFKEDESESTYSKGYTKYLANLSKGKNETTTNVTVRHEMSSDVIYALYGNHLPDMWTDYNSGAESKDPEYYGPKQEQSKKAKIPVTWISKKDK